VIVGTAGHIDHGKTSLVRALTGVDTDRLPEEKRRGITIELGFAPLAIPGLGTVGIVDVPGHEAFVRTMLAGATGVDLALLVIAADEGVMPQTREHLAILSILGVRGGVVALTKRDVGDDDWVALVREDVEGLLRGSPLEGAPIVETSVVSGMGIEELREVLAQRLRALPRRNATDLFRMPIDRAFSVKGTGTVVTGTVWSGSVSTHTPLLLYPAGRSVRARGVQSHGASADAIHPGTRAAVALAGVDLTEVERGGVLVEEAMWRPSLVLRADVALLGEGGRSIRPREWVRLHLGTTEVGARIVAAGGAMAPGEVRGARVVLDSPIVARAGDRFVLRLPSPPATIGGGFVTDPAPAHRRPRPWPAGLGAGERLSRVVRESSEHGLALVEMPVRIGIPPGEGLSLAQSVDGLVVQGGRVFDGALVRAMAEGLVGRVGDFHRAHPLEGAAPHAWLRTSSQKGGAGVDVALDQAVGDGRLEVVPGGVRLAGWVPVLSPDLLRERQWLLDRLESAGGEPPSVSELRAERKGSDPVPLLRILEREQLVVPVEPDRYYAAGTLRDMVERLRSAMVPDREYGPAELRELLGSSRKYLIPFLEYCDRLRITERRADGRVRGG